MQKKKLSKRPIKIDVEKAIAHFNLHKEENQDKMTIQSLADKIGVVRNTLYNYKNAVMRADVDVIERISVETGLPICEFVPIKFD